MTQRFSRREMLKLSGALAAGSLLAACARPYPPTPAARRTARAVRILELIGTQQAAKALGNLAKGDAKARATQQAKAALARLDKKKRDRGGQ